MDSERSRHAVVIGGSVAGLLAARVLSEHFERVTVLERDAVHDAPKARKGQPQARHLHGLLAKGLTVMTRYFPDLLEALASGGAPALDLARSMRWYAYGGYRKRFDFGSGIISSRPFLEWTLRERVIALPNVQLRDGCGVEGLLASEDRRRILGVRLAGCDERAGTLGAELVVDASGRGSATPRWLEGLGYTRPRQSAVKVDVGYASRLYARDPAGVGARDWILVTPDAPRERRMGGAFPIEGDRWIVSLGGWHGEHAPADEKGFLDFAASLPVPDVYEVASRNAALSEIVVHKFPSSLRRHYEGLARFPEGLVVLGDALCSFNPIYGQGMTSAALQAEALDRLLGERRRETGRLARTFFRRAARIVDTPGRLAVGEDFRFPETKGRKAPGTDVVNAYVAGVHRASLHDPVVGVAFFKVMNLMAPPRSLFAPGVALRVFAARSERRRAPRPGLAQVSEQRPE